MRRKLFYIYFAILLFIAFPLPTFAQGVPSGRNEIMPLKQATSPSGLLFPTGISKSIEIMTAKINKAVELIRNIQERITSRLEKMKNNDLKTDKLDTMVGSINIQIQKLDKDLAIEKNLQKTFKESSNKKIDYKAWRKQIVFIKQDITDVLKLQKNIIIEMKKSVTNVASATPTLKATVIP